MTINAQQLAAAFRAAANALDGGNANASAGAPIAQTMTGVTQAPIAQTATVTEEQLTGLIMPHVANDTIKAALGEAMRSMGVNALAEAKPHQYGPLYVAFQQVLARYGIGGAPPQQQPQSSSII